MTDKTIFNGDEDGQKDESELPYDKGGYLPPGVTVHQQLLDGNWNQEAAEAAEPKRPVLFPKVLARALQFSITMVLIAGCIWLVAAILSNLPTR